MLTKEEKNKISKELVAEKLKLKVLKENKDNLQEEMNTYINQIIEQVKEITKKKKDVVDENELNALNKRAKELREDLNYYKKKVSNQVKELKKHWTSAQRKIDDLEFQIKKQ